MGSTKSHQHFKSDLEPYRGPLVRSNASARPTGPTTGLFHGLTNREIEAKRKAAKMISALFNGKGVPISSRNTKRNLPKSVGTVRTMTGNIQTWVKKSSHDDDDELDSVC